MKHYACYWCHALVREDEAAAARLNSAVFFWHKKCSRVDPLFPVNKEEQYRPPVDYALDE